MTQAILARLSAEWDFRNLSCVSPLSCPIYTPTFTDIVIGPYGIFSVMPLGRICHRQSTRVDIPFFAISIVCFATSYFADRMTELRASATYLHSLVEQTGGYVGIAATSSGVIPLKKNRRM